jgi:hypothetical protein
MLKYSKTNTNILTSLMIRKEPTRSFGRLLTKYLIIMTEHNRIRVEYIIKNKSIDLIPTIYPRKDNLKIISKKTSSN